MTISLSNDQTVGFRSVALGQGSQSWNLPLLFGHLLTMAETRYGPRDISWTPVGVCVGDAITPKTWVQGGLAQKKVAIILGSKTANDWKRAAFQLAHETIHILSPVLAGQATVAEEGLATMFADEISAINGWGFKNDVQSYADAKKLVEELVAADKDAILNIRKTAPCFSDWMPDMILAAAPKLAPATAHALCDKFVL